jgi:hypothetical protein
MAEEINDGTAYLRALKHATSSLSGAAAAPAHEPERPMVNPSPVQGGEDFQGAEKRRSPPRQVRRQRRGAAKRDATFAPGRVSAISACTAARSRRRPRIPQALCYT